MNTNDVIDGVSIKLNKIEDTFEIYTNHVKQGLKKPCFFIKKLPSNRRTLIGNRYENTTNLAIHTMLEECEDIIEQLNNIEDKLYSLEYITLTNGDMLRGIDMKSEISDEVLIFFVTYKYFTYKEQKVEDGMENISIQGGIVNED